ncbi:MAG TPA: hypothetical protein PLD12_09090 [Bacteroidales bacterium]|nr:hypothetical protein [Bacteroidales bacterium]
MAVFTNEYENIYQFRTSYVLKAHHMRVPSDLLRKFFKIIFG